MERKEYTVNELFENQVLNDMYETRGDGLECVYIRMYGEPEETKKIRKAKKELEDLIKKITKDEKQQKELWLKLDRYEGYVYGESDFWNKQYYKLGFLDGIYLKKEMKELKKIYSKNKVDDIKDKE